MTATARRLPLLLLLILPTAGLAQDRYPANTRPACSMSSPRAIMLTKQTDDQDCDDTVSGTATAYCQCLDGATWEPVSSGSGSGTVTGLIDDASCIAGDSVVRNAGDTAFECVAVSGGSGLTHPQVMARVSVGF